MGCIYCGGELGLFRTFRLNARVRVRSAGVGAMRAYGEAKLTYEQRQSRWGGEYDETAVAGSLEKERNLSNVAHPLAPRPLVVDLVTESESDDDSISDCSGSTAVAGVAAARTAVAGAKKMLRARM